ncbi:MAG: hypothetical protein HY843_02635 [Bdellovibrio sp.]|nr:hypothetical protein [Bdellovibrio sp.]
MFNNNTRKGNFMNMKKTSALLAVLALFSLNSVLAEENVEVTTILAKSTNGTYK